jgi:hypothetical protein
MLDDKKYKNKEKEEEGENNEEEEQISFLMSLARKN